MIAIVPAWSESDGFPNKLIRNLAGKPLIAYAIDTIKDSKSVDRIIVATDSIEIASIAENYGAEVPFIHPVAANRSFFNFDSCLYTIEKLNESGEYVNEVLILEPSSLLRTDEDIEKSIELYRENNSCSVISFCEVNQSGVLTEKIVDKLIDDFLSHSPEICNRLINEKALIPNGVIFVFNYLSLKNYGIDYLNRSTPYIMPAERSLRIDTISDFEYAEYLITRSKNNPSVLINIHLYKVYHKSTIRESIKKLDETGIGFIVVVNRSDKVLGVVTDGDFRRAVLSGAELNAPILTIANKDFIFLNEGYTREEVDKTFMNDIAHLPVLNDGKLKGLILRKNLPVSSKQSQIHRKLDTPVVIMAGGKGTRLEPFTHIMPKPLVPIGNKPIIEIIIEKFTEFGVKEFYLSLNYKANMIKAYFEGSNLSELLRYVIEDIPLGTAGSLKKIKDKIKSTFIVTNCDIIIKSDYSEIVNFHKAGLYDLTLVACMQHFTIPYGVCYVGDSGDLKEISEKPEYDYLVNTGMYVLEPGVLDLIPDDTFYHITQLINDLKKNNKKIGVFPVYEKSWIDVGQWEEYRKTIKYFE